MNVKNSCVSNLLVGNVMHQETSIHLAFYVGPIIVLANHSKIHVKL